MASWFEADRHGLRKIVRKRGIEFVVIELIQNALDERTTVCTVSLTKTPQRRQRYLLRVTDDSPEGFADLTHAYTLFADSDKKQNPEQRGRFNLGEKLAIAICENASIATTTGVILFDERGRTKSRKGKTEAGSVFEGEIVMSDEEFVRVREKIQTILPPRGIDVVFNEVSVPHRNPLQSFQFNLPTIKADEEGNLTKTRRTTRIDILRPLPREKAMIYEMGLPVVETGDSFHVNVHQKVPLNMNRDNVTPSYLRELRTAVLNHSHGLLDAEEMTGTWVKNAIEDERVEDEAVEHIVGTLFPRPVRYDPSDPEANKRAMAEGHTVIPGRAFSSNAWRQVRRADVALPSGQVTPSPKPYGEGGEVRKEIAEKDWTEDVRRTAKYAKMLARELLDITDLDVRIVSDPAVKNFGATYVRLSQRSGQMEFNWRTLGSKWFRIENFERITNLILHELGHHVSGDHLSADYYRALTKLGAKALVLGLEKPESFAPYRAVDGPTDLG